MQRAACVDEAGGATGHSGDEVLREAVSDDPNGKRGWQLIMVAVT
jgi:hypothetical protein